MWRPAPGQIIKTNSPTQGDTHQKVPLLGSPTMPLLYCPNLATTIDEWKNDVEPTRHGAVVAGKFVPYSSTTLPAHNLAEKSRHDACLVLLSFPLAPARDCDPVLARCLGHKRGAMADWNSMPMFIQPTNLVNLSKIVYTSYHLILAVSQCPLKIKFVN
jgi:hypothetical protein